MTSIWLRLIETVKDQILLRPCLKDPISEIFDAAKMLSEAVSAHLSGDENRAANFIREADCPRIAEWTETIWGSKNKNIHGFVSVLNSPPIVAIDSHHNLRMPDAQAKRLIILRDGYHCRFCGIPVITSDVRRRIQKKYSEALRWGATNREQHAAFQCMWLQYDHLLPFQRGGGSSVDNIVITCAPCNFGRMQATLEEARLIDPRTRPARSLWAGSESWDGLTRFAH